MNKAARAHKHSFTDFERISRTLRWFAIAAVIATLPISLGQSYIIYALAVVGVLFNLTRYSTIFLQWRFYASPATVLAIDTMFIGLLLTFVGTINTPYIGFLIFPITSAAYIFGLKGVLTVAVAEILWLPVALWASPFPPLVLNNFQGFILTASIVLALGLLMERLTRSDRRQRDKLQELSYENAAESSRLMALLNSINDAVYVVDSHSHVVEHNEMATSLTDQTGNLRGKRLKDILPLRNRTNPEQVVDLLRDSHQPQHRRDLTVQAEHGVTYDLDIQVAPIVLSGRKSTDYIVVARDITKERSLDEQRKEFVSVAAHELKTPVAIMEAALSSILHSKDTFSEQNTIFLGQAHRNALQLGGLIKDLGLLAEAQNDNLPIELTEVDPGALLDELVAEFQPQAKQQGLSLSCSTAEDTPIVLSTERHVKEILQNYLTNALKYTKEKGKIKLAATPSSDGGVIFSVSDHGIGISRSDQKRLFTKYFRAEDYRTRETGGTGLGLYLCRELAERLNGKTWVKSTLNKGSTFYLAIPPSSRLGRDRGEVAKAQLATFVNNL